MKVKISFTDGHKIIPVATQTYRVLERWCSRRRWQTRLAAEIVPGDIIRIGGAEYTVAAAKPLTEAQARMADRGILHEKDYRCHTSGCLCDHDDLDDQTGGADMKTIMDYLATAPIPPIMTSIDTRALIRKMRQNDGQSESAREELVNSGLLLILIVLLRFTDRQEPLTRLFQVGLAGLAKAIVLFDLEQSFDFVPYALSMISKEIRHHLGEDTAT